MVGKISQDTKRRHAPYTKFKAFMDENNISQDEIADVLGKTRSAVNQNLNGTGGDFSVVDVRKLCRRYNISADEFFIEHENFFARNVS